LIPKYADTNGRKPVLLVTYIAVVIISVGIIFSTSTLFTTFLLFFLGMTANGTCNVSFVMMIESSVPEWRASAGSWLNVFGFAQPFFLGFYFMFVSNQYIFILIFALILAIAAVALMVLVIEESPLYLMKKGEYERANTIMRKIHRINVGAKQAVIESYEPLISPNYQIHETSSKDPTGNTEKKESIR